jgi:hypothetical protein
MGADYRILYKQLALCGAGKHSRDPYSVTRVVMVAPKSVANLPRRTSRLAELLSHPNVRNRVDLTVIEYEEICKRGLPYSALGTTGLLLAPDATDEMKATLRRIAWKARLRFSDIAEPPAEPTGTGYIDWIVGALRGADEVRT